MQKNYIFAVRYKSSFVMKQAKVAQLIEHHLAKVGVAGLNPVFRSNKKILVRGFSF